MNAASVFSRRLLQWYDKHQRTLPWRLERGAEREARLDPYHVLVSESMLQQTQVSTVIPYFQRFIARFPTIQSLAEADEQQVLRLWQGLGYYARARNLQAAAKAIAANGGHVPETVQELLRLPGVGRYTAGAVSSLAFGHRAPILDGNVARVLCRLDCLREDPREKGTREILWARAEEILPKKRLGDFNSALMELGALICVPRSPQCLICPVRGNCRAFEAGLQEVIPLRKKTKAVPLLKRWVFCIRRKDQYLIEQRPMRGRWAGMWQFVTMEAGESVSAAVLSSYLSLHIGKLTKMGDVSHRLTHRMYEFEVFACEARGEPRDMPTRQWVELEKIEGFAMSKPQVEAAGLLRARVGR